MQLGTFVAYYHLHSSNKHQHTSNHGHPFNVIPEAGRNHSYDIGIYLREASLRMWHQEHMTVVNGTHIHHDQVGAKVILTLNGTTGCRLFTFDLDVLMLTNPKQYLY